MTRHVLMPPRDDFWADPCIAMHPTMHWTTLPPNGHQFDIGLQGMNRQDTQGNPAYSSQDEGHGPRGQPRAQRAQQACRNCRQKKTKCSESRPTCTQCRSTGIDCVYSPENLPTKRQLNFQDITERLDKHEALSGTISEQLNTFDERFGAIEAVFERFLTEMGDYRQRSLAPNNESASPRSTQTAKILPMTWNNMPTSVAIPHNHSTPANKLVLTWPSIKSFFCTVGEKDYMTSGEQARDTLAKIIRNQRAKASAQSIRNRLPVLGTQQHVNLSVNDNDSVSINDSMSPASSSMPGTSFTAYSSATSLGCRFHDALVEFTVPPKLSLTLMEAKSTFRTYVQQIHILHPIIDIVKTENFINNSIVDKPLESTPMQRGSSSSSVRSYSKRNLKRKQSSSDDDFSPVTDNANSTNDGPADTAVALLVISLGKLAAGRIEVHNDNNTVMAHQPNNGMTPEMYAPYYMRDTFADVPVQWPQQTSATHSFESGAFDGYDPRSPIAQTSFTSVHANAGDSDSSTVDYPGLAFYSHATQIIGELAGGEVNLAYVHAMLLAGLYCSLLVRPLESARWINMASTTMQEVIKLNRGAADANRTDVHVNSTRITYWTCYQLESDILAELDHPQSGISRYESKVQLPKGRIPQGVLFDCDLDEAMWYFCQQVHLQRLLNLAHAKLYDVRGRYTPLAAKKLMVSLQEWRQNLTFRNSPVTWDDNDPPTNNIYAARMRAKYYCTTYIINRPALQQAVAMFHDQAMVNPDGTPEHRSSQLNTFQSVRDWTEVSEAEALDIAQIIGLDLGTLEGCRRCVHAAVKSIEAFDKFAGMRVMLGRHVTHGTSQQFNVTNIFGIAQAQFSNILVLAAVVKSNFLCWLVPGQMFKDLLCRTKYFVTTLASTSPTMAKNLEVLLQVENLFAYSDPVDTFPFVSDDAALDMDDTILH